MIWRRLGSASIWLGLGAMFGLQLHDRLWMGAVAWALIGGGAVICLLLSVAEQKGAATR